MKSDLIRLLQHQKGRRLWTILTVGSVLGAELVVVAMDLLLKGEVTADYLLTGLVAACIVAPPSLALLAYLLDELAKQQQQALANSLNNLDGRLRVILDSSDEGILMIAPDGQVLAANKRFRELWRVPAELSEAPQDNLLLAHVLDQLVSPEAFIAEVQRLYGSNEEASDTLQFKDGRTFARYSRPLSNSAAQGRLWCFRDITEQARTQAILAEREMLYRTIVSQAGDGIDLVDAQTLRFVEVNEAACRMLGYTHEELIGAPLALIQADLDESAVRSEIARLPATTSKRIEVRHRCKDGRIIDVEVTLRRIQLDGRQLLVGVWHDVSERKRAATALRESHNLLQAIINAVPMRVFWKDNELRYLGCNPAFARDAGKAEPEELLGKEDFAMAWAAQAEQYRADDRHVMDSGAPKLLYDEPQTTPAGNTIWLRTSKVPLRNLAGETIGLLGVYEDITERREIEQALHRSEESARSLATMLRLMCDNVPDMIWAKDLEQRYLFANKAFCEQLLVAKDTVEPIGKTDIFFTHRQRESRPDVPDWHTYGEICLETDLLTLERGEACVFEESGTVGGKQLFLEVHKAPFLNAAGEVIGTVGSARDITARKQIEKELEQHQRHLEDLVEERSAELLATEARASHILQSSADGLYGVDPEGRITFINPAACALLGYRPEEVVGRFAHAQFHHSYPDGSPYPVDICPSHSALLEGREERVDNEVYWHADGHPVPVMYAVHPMWQKNRIIGGVISFVDMTSQRAATLARENALDAAERLARVRSEFLANMSHEIRTPLNGVLGFAQIGLRNSSDQAKTQMAFDKILASGNRLLGIVNDILDFSKIDAGKLALEAIELSLGETLEHAIELVSDRAHTKGVVLRLEKSDTLPDSCIGDPLRLGQVLLNLLSNAIKFTEHGEVVLSAGCEENTLVFSIRDTGIGMSAAQIELLFTPFQQGDNSTTRRFGGTGLGLAICQRILALMGGSIRVDSTPNAGSIFEFRLPYVAPHPIPASGRDVLAPEHGGRALTGISILLAEDDPVNQAVLEDNLLEEGARVVLANNGREAVDRVEKDGPSAYDIVLMDVQMPEMDGYEATRRIFELAPGLPVIGQTAHAFEDERRKCFAAGMVDHLTKPIDHARLVATILEHLDKSRFAGPAPG